MRRTVLTAAATACLALSAVAQTRVCMGGDLSALTVAERHSCENQVRLVQKSGGASRADGGWHFIVVCGESGWKEYSAFSQSGESQLADAAADTDFATKTIFLRGTRLQDASAVELAVSRALQAPAPNAVQVALK